MQKVISEANFMDLLKTIVLTLEDIEVKGSDNMSKLLGCINALNRIIEEQESAPQEDGEENGR